MSGSPRIPRQREQDNDQQRDDQRQTEDGQHEQPQQGPGSTSRPVYGSPSPPPTHPFFAPSQHQYPPTVSPAQPTIPPPLRNEDENLTMQPPPSGHFAPFSSYSAARYPPYPSYQPPYRIGSQSRLPQVGSPMDTSFTAPPHSAAPDFAQTPARPSVQLPPGLQLQPILQLQPRPTQYMQPGYGGGPHDAQHNNGSAAPTAPMMPPGRRPLSDSADASAVEARRREQERRHRDASNAARRERETDTDHAGAGDSGGARPGRKRKTPLKPVNNPDEDSNAESERDTHKPKRRKKPLRPIDEREAGSETDEELRKKGAGKFCDQPKKSQRRPKVAEKATDADQIWHGASVHKDKDNKFKRGVAKHISWVLPRGDTLLEASGFFSNPGEPYFTRRETVDRQMRQTRGVNSSNEQERNGWLAQARNTWSGSLTRAMNDFWGRRKHLDQAQQAAIDTLKENRRSNKDNMDNWAPVGRLRLLMTPEELQKRDQDFQQAQTLAASGDESGFARFPQLAPLPADVNAPVAAPSTAPSTTEQGGDDQIPEDQQAESPVSADDAPAVATPTAPSTTGQAGDGHVPEDQQPESTSPSRRTSPRLRPVDDTAGDAADTAATNRGDDDATFSTLRLLSTLQSFGLFPPMDGTLNTPRVRGIMTRDLSRADIAVLMEQYPLRYEDGNIIDDPKQWLEYFIDEYPE